MDPVDLDNNATTIPLPGVRQAVERALVLGGNPSSPHAAGRAARALLSEAREAVAALLGAAPREIVFTSGGTEADNLAVIGGAQAAVAEGADRRVVTTAVEHPAVEDACAHLEAAGFEVVRVGVDAEGLPDAGALAAAVTPGTALLAVMLLQNETGALLPVAEAFARARAVSPRVRLHTDAVQAFGKVPFSPAALGADTLAVSAHKIHGPQGIGALWIREGREPSPRARGGKQERGLRTGTENVPGAAGFGAAAAAALAEGPARRARAQALGLLLEEGALALPGARRNGPPIPRRHPGTLNVSFDGVRGDLLLMALDAAGVRISTGSACASGAPLPSRSLLATGMPAQRAREAVRLSLGALNTEQDVRRALGALGPAVAGIRAGVGTASA